MVFFFSFLVLLKSQAGILGGEKIVSIACLRRVEGNCGLRAQDLFSLCSFLFGYMTGTHCSESLCAWIRPRIHSYITGKCGGQH